MGSGSGIGGGCSGGGRPSGMSIVEFCEHEGLKASTFHYWQREIRRRDEELQSDGWHAQTNEMGVASVVWIIDTSRSKMKT